VNPGLTAFNKTWPDGYRRPPPPRPPPPPREPPPREPPPREPPPLERGALREPLLRLALLLGRLPPLRDADDRLDAPRALALRTEDPCWLLPESALELRVVLVRGVTLVLPRPPVPAPALGRGVAPVPDRFAADGRAPAVPDPPSCCRPASARPR
jgi:hypothetical protein